MKASEIAELLTFMAAFDRRTLGPADVEAWATLPIFRLDRTRPERNVDLALAKEAVILFHDQEPDSAGNSHYLDAQQFRRYVRRARERRETEAARARAKVMVTRGPADPRPADFEDQVNAAWHADAARTEAHADEYTEQQKAANRARLDAMMAGGK